MGLCCPIGGVEKIAIRQRSHALCNELGLWIGLVLAMPWIGMEPDFIAGIVRHFVRSAIKDHGYEDQRQEGEAGTGPTMTRLTMRRIRGEFLVTAPTSSQ